MSYFVETLQWLHSLGWVFQAFLIILATAVVHFMERRLYSRLHPRLRRSHKLWDDTILYAIHPPLGWLIWVFGISFALEIIEMATEQPLFYKAITPARNVILIGLLVWAFLRFIIRLEERWIQHVKHKEDRLDRTTIHALSQLLRTAVLVTAGLIALQTLGINISAVLAFGGIGAIAIGFAAKDMLANYFGGLMVYLSRPFAVGDWIRSPDKDIEGIVEYIGWRLTRILSFDKRPIYVPNALFSTIVVVNPSRMTNRRIYTNIGLRYDDAEKVADVLKDVEKMLRFHPEEIYKLLREVRNDSELNWLKWLGLRIDIQDPKGLTPIHASINNGDLDTLKRLLQLWKQQEILVEIRYENLSLLDYVLDRIDKAITHNEAKDTLVTAKGHAMLMELIAEGAWACKAPERAIEMAENYLRAHYALPQLEHALSHFKERHTCVREGKGAAASTLGHFPPQSPSPSSVLPPARTDIAAAASNLSREPTSSSSAFFSSPSPKTQLGWNCFDAAIGIERESLVQFALENTHDPAFRQLLAPEIRHAAALTVAYTNLQVARERKDVQMTLRLVELFEIAQLLDPDDSWNRLIIEKNITALLDQKCGARIFPRGTLPQSMHTDALQQLFNEYQSAHEAMIEAVAACNDTLGHPEGRRLSLAELDAFFASDERRLTFTDAFAAFQKARTRLFTPHEQKLSAYCEDAHTYHQYITGYYNTPDDLGHKGWVAFQRSFRGETNTSIIDIAARLIEGKIIVYQREEEHYKIIHQTESYGNMVKHIEFQGNNHFINIDDKVAKLSQHTQSLRDNNEQGEKPPGFSENSLAESRPITQAAASTEADNHQLFSDSANERGVQDMPILTATQMSKIEQRREESQITHTIDVMEPNDNTAFVTNLFMTCGKGDVTQLRSLLMQPNVNPNVRNQKQFTLLIHIAEQKHLSEDVQIELTRLLLKMGANVELRHPFKGWTALHCAAAHGRSELCRELIHCRAAIDPRASDGATPLIVAASFSGNESVLSLLIEEGADVKACTRPASQSDGGKNTALHVAVQCGCVKNAASLINHGLSIRQRTQNDFSLIHLIDTTDQGMLNFLGLDTEDIQIVQNIQASMRQLQIERTDKKHYCLATAEKKPSFLERELEDAHELLRHGDEADRASARMNLERIQHQINSISYTTTFRQMTNEEYTIKLIEHYQAVNVLLSKIENHLRPPDVENLTRQTQKMTLH